MRGADDGGGAGDGQPRGVLRGRQQRTLRAQRVQAHDRGQRAALHPPHW